MSKQPLTVNQELAYEVICDHWKDKGRSPSVHEVADCLNIADNGAAEHIKALRRKGWIENAYGQTRDICPIGIKDHIKTFPFHMEHGDTTTCTDEQTN